MRFRRQKPDEVIAVSVSPVSGRVAKLVRKDGRLICECPYLCDAASEPCEFKDKFDDKGNPIYRCSLCWAKFDTEEELAQHIEIEQALTYRVDGEGYE